MLFVYTFIYQFWNGHVLGFEVGVFIKYFQI